MPKVTGTVEDLQEREGSGGGRYVRVRLAGQESGFFDCSGRLAEAGVNIGDEIAVEFGDGRYPRVQAVTRLKGGGASDAPAAQFNGNGRPSWRDLQIVRLTCAKAAACLLQSSGLEPDEKTQQAIAAAERLEAWVLR